MSRLSKLYEAMETLKKEGLPVIKSIGVERVRRVVEKEKLVFCRVPLISNRLDKKYGRTQVDIGNGWYVITHSNNTMKKNVLEKISQALGLGLIVNLEE